MLQSTCHAVTDTRTLNLRRPAASSCRRRSTWCRGSGTRVRRTVRRLSRRQEEVHRTRACQASNSSSCSLSSSPNISSHVNASRKAGVQRSVPPPGALKAGRCGGESTCREAAGPRLRPRPQQVGVITRVCTCIVSATAWALRVSAAIFARATKSSAERCGALFYRSATDAGGAVQRASAPPSAGAGRLVDSAVTVLCRCVPRFLNPKKSLPDGAV